MRFLLFALCLVACTAAAQSDTDFAPVAKKITAAMASEARSDADKQRDANRRPVETLEFFGLREDMRVLELFPGRGWYSRILAPVLAKEGEFLLALGTSRVAERQASDPALATMRVLEVDASIEPTEIGSIYKMGEFTFPVTDVDLVLTFRNQHNFTAPSRAHMNAAVFDALKPGGHYGVVDHTARHMSPDSEANRRRLDPVLVINEIEAAGFEFVDFSDLHYRPVDELDLEVGEEGVTGRTDRFTLLFRKPAG